MRTETCPVGAHIVDSYPFSILTRAATTAEALKASGVDGLVGYLGCISKNRLDEVLGAGLGFMPVTLAGHYHGPSSVQYCQELGLTTGCTVWLDLEGQTAFETPPLELIAKINEWCASVTEAGYMAGLYVGVPQPLTSQELSDLASVRYWHGQGSIRDRHNQLAEPSHGWCMMQFFPQHLREGILVDDDMVGQDYLGRVPNWVIA